MMVLLEVNELSRTAGCLGTDGCYPGIRMSRVPIPAHLALTPENDDFRRQFEQLADQAEALVAPLSEMQFTWKPSTTAWSIAECIDHLNVTARLYLPLLDEGIANAI